MIRLLTDENFDHRILRGLIRRLPHLDYVLVSDVGLSSQPDLVLLRWAAKEQRVVLTQDLKTLVRDAERLVMLAEPMAGVIAVPKNLRIGRAIDDLELLIACCSESEMRNAIQRLPL